MRRWLRILRERVRCKSQLVWLWDGEDEGAVQCARPWFHNGLHRQWGFAWNDSVQVRWWNHEPLPASHARVTTLRRLRDGDA